MLRELISCCAGIVLLTGCGITSESGKWRPIEGDEFASSFAVVQVVQAEGYCNVMASNAIHDRCVDNLVEPLRRSLDETKERIYREGLVEVVPDNSGPFNLSETETAENNSRSSAANARIAVAPIAVALQF